MEIIDYYAESLPSNVTQTINPLKATAGVMLVWGAITGVINFKRYKNGNITKKQAVTATASESVGMGLAAGLGLLAVKASILMTAAPVALPFIVGVVVTTGAKITWDCKTKQNMIWCERKECQETASAIATA